jgi:nicotinate-nucleotide--dimethylbenzimidazole phosphoribosyltransferase
MAATNRSLVTPTSNQVLEKALRVKLQRRNEISGSLGELEPLAVRLGLMQGTLKPRLQGPHLLVFAADHGLAVDGLRDPQGRATHETVRLLLTRQLPLAVFADSQQIEVTVVDCGIAETMAPHDRLLMRKIAHGTRNARIGPAMSLEQAHAGMRAGMEIGDKLRGNCTALAGLGVGAHESAALLLARMTDTPVRNLVLRGPDMEKDHLARLLSVMKAAQVRHRDVVDPIEVLATFGGFEVAVMVGVMLMAASKRHLLMIDGVPACAALMIAARIAKPVTDYCVFCRSHGHRGLDQALNLFRASALLELGIECTDGTGAALAWPLVKASAALLTDVVEGEDPGPSRPPDWAELPVLEAPVSENSPLGDALY